LYTEYIMYVMKQYWVILKRYT